MKGNWKKLCPGQITDPQDFGETLESVTTYEQINRRCKQ